MRTIDKIKELIIKLGGTPSEKPRVNDQLDKLCGCQFGVKSWNDLTDRPFGEEKAEVILEFDGDLTGREVVSRDDASYVKVTDSVLTADKAIGSTVRMTFGDELQEFLITSDNVTVTDRELHIAPEDMTAVFSVIEPGDGLSVGTYFFVYLNEDVAVAYIQSISCLTTEGIVVKTLDEKYLPESVKYTSNIIQCDEEISAGVRIPVDIETLKAIRKSIDCGKLPFFRNYEDVYCPISYNIESNLLHMNFVLVKFVNEEYGDKTLQVKEIFIIQEDENTLYVGCKYGEYTPNS